MATKINIEDAAKVVMDAEAAALNRLKELLDALDGELEAVEDTLPTTLSMDARRIVSEVRSALVYKRNTDIPQILSRYTLNQTDAPSTGV